MLLFVKFALAGILSNSACYLLYLALTYFGVGHKLAMTMVYLTGTVTSFIANGYWTFSYKGPVASAMARFAAAYGLGYLVNMALLVVFVDRLGCDHRLVQAAAIVVVAFLLFAMLRVFVFRKPADGKI